MRGAVCCPQPRACDIGAAILEAGGNAFDAAVGAAFAQMIDDPFMCGLGGMGSAQVYAPHKGVHEMIEFHSRAGSKVRPDMWAESSKGHAEIGRTVILENFASEIGYQSIMIPGAVAGFAELHERHGTLPWSEVLAPVVAMAREGLLVMPYFVEFLTRKVEPGIATGRQRIEATQACKEIYLKHDGSLWETGDVVLIVDHAATLQRIAEEGGGEFYRGDLGREIAADLEANGSFITRDDLAAYRPRIKAPLISSYRGLRVASNPPPGSGAVLIEALNVLENFDLRGMRHTGVDHLDLLARTMSLVHADRIAFLGDPEFAEIPTEKLIDKAHAAQIAERIRGEVPAAPKQPVSCTTHLSVCDEEGNVASITHTLGTASGVVTPGLGFIYNNSMKLFDVQPGRPNSMAPGKARIAGMVPTIVFRDGTPLLVVGALGGTVMISGVLQTILNVVDFDMTATDAVLAPRIHCEGGRVFAEARLQQSTCDSLAARGHQVLRRPYSLDSIQSRVFAIQIGVGEIGDGQIGDGAWRAAPDLRAGGGGLAYAGDPRGPGAGVSDGPAR